MVMTLTEIDAILFVLRFWRRSVKQNEIFEKMNKRIFLANDIIRYCSTHEELPSNENQINVVVEILYDFLVIETMNECRGLLSLEELKRLEIVRTIFAKILVNSPVNGREHRFGSIYLAPAELVKIGLHKMLQYPEIELLHYAKKSDGGMLRFVSQFLWKRDFSKNYSIIMH